MVYIAGCSMRSIFFLGILGVLVVCAAVDMRKTPVQGRLEWREHRIMKMRELNDSESHVLLNKGTERPFTGEYVGHKADGVYTCRQCGLGMYDSESKFDSGCGWPSFDEFIDDTVKMQPDPDGVRTEIVCARCGAHLGHVFYGEGFTPKNTRHCVNSISMLFVAREDIGTAVFGGGCFWGVEARLQSVPGVIDTAVGYTGGHLENPTYEQVCAGDSGHIEVVKVRFNPATVSYADLMDFFFHIHDATQYRRQGPDMGYQYQSSIFYADEDQKKAAEQEIARLKSEGVDIKTELLESRKFWMAEEYHQSYLRKQGRGFSCGS